MSNKKLYITFILYFSLLFLFSGCTTQKFVKNTIDGPIYAKALHNFNCQTTDTAISWSFKLKKNMKFSIADLSGIGYRLGFTSAFPKDTLGVKIFEDKQLMSVVPYYLIIYPNGNFVNVAQPLAKKIGPKTISFNGVCNIESEKLYFEIIDIR